MLPPPKSYVKSWGSVQFFWGCGPSGCAHEGGHASTGRQCVADQGRQFWQDVVLYNQPGSRSRGQGQMKVKPINLLVGASGPYWHCDDARYKTKDIYLPLNVYNPNAAAYTRHSFRDHGIVPTKTI